MADSANNANIRNASSRSIIRYHLPVVIGSGSGLRARSLDHHIAIEASAAEFRFDSTANLTQYLPSAKLLPTLIKPGATVLPFSMLLFAIVGLSLFITGVVYLSVEEFMPYHAQALQADWNDLDSKLQGLILGLLRGLGSGAAVAGLAILYMAGTSLAKNPRSFLLLLPSVAIGYTALLAYATCTVQVNTPGNPPLGLIIALVVVSCAATIALALSQRERPDG